MRSWLLLMVLSLAVSPAFAEFTMDTLPIQDGGRLKPFNTFARESLTLLHGRSKFQGEEATKIVTTWMLVPEAWDNKEFIRIDHSGLRKSLGLSEEKGKLFSFRELMESQRLDVVIGELAVKTQDKEKLNPFFQAAQRLNHQLTVYHAIKLGAFRIVPNADPQDSSWQYYRDLEEPLREKFQKVLNTYALTFTSAPTPASEAELKLAIENFVTAAKAVNPQSYPLEKPMRIETHYNQFHPFMWAWIIYLIAMIFFFLSILFKEKKTAAVGWILSTVAFLLHTYGFALRVYITERPPVSNMYETVVWVGWGTIVFAAVLAFVKRGPFAMLAGTAVAAICMVAADFAPLILDGSLQPLEPVLRSNLWLVIHVMTITLAYAAFFLALGIGNVGLFYMIRTENRESATIRELVDTCYKSLQVGVVLLAAGTILGGVWADYSWGRFWGWDPKETWALIALLGYLAVLHGRLAGWLKNFGMFAGAVIAFNLVIMAWYGVNFVLGAGLHSYGFGAGGIEYVSVFVGAQLLYVVYSGIISLRN
ncbi:MAG: cytochrome c biogenesis protein CcsA [Bdellovibrionales bacterium]|nr:cytochrome c biogenesis protein CcsA [Bdellovibrionales bacterium]